MEGMELEKLLQLVQVEIESNANVYTPYVRGNLTSNLFTEMNLYVYSKVYDTSFGDLVPAVISRVTNMNLIIVKNGQSSRDNCIIVQAPTCPIVSYENSVFVYKSGAHYDGMVTNPEYNDRLITNIDGYHMLPHDDMVNYEMPTRALSHTYLPESYLSRVINSRDIHTSRNDISPIVNISGETVSRPIACNNHDTNSHVMDPSRSNVHSFTTKNVKFCSWNMCGLYDYKLCDDMLGPFLKLHDVIFVTETWAWDNDYFNLEGYVYHNFNRKSKHANAKRNSGGIGIFIRRELTEGIEIKKCINDVVVWVKLIGKFFGTVRDIYIAIAYIVPEGSTHAHRDAFALLHNDIAAIPQGAEILLCGDYNAHTNIENDYMIESLTGTNGELEKLFCDDYTGRYELICKLSERKMLQRFSQDSKRVDNHGRFLLKLCKAAGLLIPNGRVGQDRGIGACIRVNQTSATLVDYVIASPGLIGLINDFEISKKFPEFDHLAISFRIKCDMVVKPFHDVKISGWDPHMKYIWSELQLDNLKAALQDDYSSIYLERLKKSLVDMDETNKVAHAANDLICQAADRVFEVTRGKRAYKSSGPKWDDAECRNMRSIAVKAGERVHSQTDRDNLSEKCRQYRAYKQMKKRKFRNETINAIEDACIRNSPNFWKLIDRVCPQPLSLNGPTGKEFTDYFKELSVPQHRDYFDNSLENEAKSFLNRYDPVIDNTYNRASYLENKIINDYFTVTEIENAIDCLKCNKAPGVDHIPAEFIKHCKSILSDTITEVLNYIVEKRDFPECWAEGLRSAIHKSGRYEVPENYRGITILPVLEKVFEIAV